ncbi:MAG: hypothetical protein LBK42_11215 [Propionibacteriaceae bacterium]|jgi:hypothetical protein|nr:hypothetical protein [Propionibacteriaceae bacterium]
MTDGGWEGRYPQGGVYAGGGPFVVSGGGGLAQNAGSAAPVLDPALPAAALAQLAYDRPEWRAAVAGHPAAYPGLLDWLDTLGDPAVSAAVAARRAGEAATVLPVPPPPPVAALGAVMAPAAYEPVGAFGPAGAVPSFGPQPGYQPSLQYGAANPADKDSFGWAVLGFFVPMVGLVLWLVWQRDRPKDSRRARNGFIAGMIANTIVVILYIIFVFAWFSSY